MYAAAVDRYQSLPYARCGRSGLQLPRISLGLWQNFGYTKPFENAREMVLKSFDHGITHFDLATIMVRRRVLPRQISAAFWQPILPGTAMS
jgi:diketogulonate reductase-like aldo/keto reductase